MWGPGQSASFLAGSVLFLSCTFAAVTHASDSPPVAARQVDRPVPTDASEPEPGVWALIGRLRAELTARRPPDVGSAVRSPQPAAATETRGWSVLTGLSRDGHVVGFDPVARHLVVLGGKDDRAWWGECWTHSLEPTGSWHRVFFEWMSSVEDFGAWEGGPFVYDSANRQLLQFGGLTRSGCHPYCTGNACHLEHRVLVVPSDPSRPAHRMLVPAPPGLSRRGHASAYDPRRQRMLVFGGDGEEMQSFGHICVGRPLADLWELSLGDSFAWRPVEQSGQVPSAVMWRTAHATVDSLRDRMFLARTDSLWSLDLASHVWRFEGSTPRLDAAVCLAVDAPSDELLLYTEGVVWSRPLASHGGWLRVSTDTGPQGGAAVTWDPVDRRFIAHASLPSSFPRQSATSEWRRASAVWRIVETGSLPNSAYHAMVYDPADDAVFSLGGFGSSGANELFVLDPATSARWSRVPAASPPSERVGHSLVLDSRRHRLLLFGGGELGRDSTDNDVYELRLDPPLTWNRIPATGPRPPAMAMHAAAYDEALDRMLVHSGFPIGSPYSPQDEVWELSLAASPRWRRLEVQGPGPGGRAGHGAVYDPVAREFMIVGGLVLGGPGGDAWKMDCWTLTSDSLPRWTRREDFLDRVDPNDLVLPTLAFDTARERVVALHAGWYPASTLFARRSSGGDWRAIDDARWDLRAPENRVQAPLVYDRFRDRVVMAGGEGIWRSVLYDDTRAYTWGEPKRDVVIEIRPGEDPNIVNPRSNGRLPVLVLSEPRFDATTIDVATLRLAGAPVRSFGKDKPAVRFEDANGDGRADLVADFVPAELAVAPGDTVAELTGKAAGNTTIRGRDRIEVRGHVASERSAETALAAADDRPGHLAIRGARLAPDGAALAAEFAGVVAGPGVLELFDIRGRRVAGPTPVALEPRYRRFEVRTGSRLSSGIYFVRLRQSGVAITSRIVFIE